MRKLRFVERTLVLVKPDAVMRGIIGQILERFERAGLKLVGLKMSLATRQQLDMHFPRFDKAWIRGIGERTLKSYKELGLDPLKETGTSDPVKIGKMVLRWNYEYLLSGPVVAMVLEGPRAISAVRKIIGDTLPINAAPGTIRGDFSTNSADFSNSVESACKNVVHASGNGEEASKEIGVWFKEGELVCYTRAEEHVMFHKIIGERKENAA